MSAAQIHIVGLQFVALMLAAIMTIAWHSFGRSRHARIWAIAFYVATAAWSCNLLLRTLPSAELIFEPLTLGLSSLFYALIAIGFILRLERERRVTPLVVAALLASLTIGALGLLIEQRGIRSGLWLGFAGVMMVISSARVTSSPRKASTAERAAVVMLLLFAAIKFMTAMIALSEARTGDEQAFALFRAVLLLLDPPGFIGVGLFTVFLVAVDLAEQMRILATSDLLTGIFNRRGFEEAAERAIRNAQRQRQPLSVVVSDIDNFKAINDRYGHAAGDKALKHFASRLERLIRRGDLIGRIGGEEFALLLVNTRPTDALDVVERIRRDIAAMPVQGSASIVMTASFGNTGLRPGDTALGNLLARADRALYRSKMEGRDRVTSAEAIDEPGITLVVEA